MDQHTSILDQARHWPVHYKKGHLIYDEGESSKSVYRVDRGCVRLQVNGPGGDRQIVAFVFPGELFGLCVDRRNSSAEAVIDTDLTRYALPSVLELSGRSPEVTFMLMRTAETLYGDLAHHVEQIAHLTAPDRVLWFLHWLMARVEAKAGEPVRIPMTRRDIADYLGLSQETLSRVTRQLQTSGTLVVKGPRTFMLRRPGFPLHAITPLGAERMHPNAA